MAWVKIESSVSRNRKFQLAGPTASWLWLCGLCYCQEGLTDGLIPSQALPFLGVSSPRKHADTLVSVGLWEVVAAGWQVHDYLSHQRSASFLKEVSTRRVQSGRAGGLARSKLLEHNGQHIAKQSAKQTLKPEQITTEQNRKDLGADAPIARAQAATSAIYSTEHRKHAHCGRICLHASLFSEFVRRRGTPTADAELRDWAMVIEREWGLDGPKAHVETGDSFVFWRARYEEKWPAAKASAASSRDPQWVLDARARRDAKHAG